MSLPSAITSHGLVVLASRISQTFPQLVLRCVILVGQNVPAAAADSRSEAICDNADAVRHEAVKTHEHLAVQDIAPSALVDTMQALPR